MRREQTNHGDEDDALIARFLAGDRDAFDRLYDRHHEYVYRIVMGVLGRPEEARDITQEVFLQVYRSLGSFRRGSRFGTWLYRVAVNRALDAARASRSRPSAPLEDAATLPGDPRDDPAAVAVVRDGERQVREVLQSLPERHRAVLVLRHFEDMSIEQMAEVLGCSVTAAKVRLFRARMHFRDAYVARFGTNADASG